MGKDEVQSQRQAWDVYDRWFEDSRVFFLEEPANLEKMFRGISKQARPAAKDWVDSYLLAFAEAAVFRWRSRLTRRSSKKLVSFVAAICVENAPDLEREWTRG
jgi:hypothetical protein